MARVTRVLLALSAASLALPNIPAAERAPSVVLILADDVGYECFGAYGSRQYSTPRVDRLAHEGVRFANCYSTPLCTPSRVALMTGMGNARNYADFGALLPDQFTLADLFRNAGYATAIAGKWQLQGSDSAAGVPAGHGFDTYCLWNTGNTGRSRYWDPSIERDGEIMDLGPDRYGPDIFADFLLDFIEANRDRPFFAYYPMVLPHSPFPPTPHSRERDSQDEQRNFEDMVAYVDYLVGRFEDRLAALGLGRSAVLVFTADNGSHHQLRSRLGGVTIQGDKGAPTDAGTHVPLVVSAPGMIDGGRVIDDLVDFADFLPTLAEAANLPLPDSLELDGISFWPRLRGETAPVREWHYTYYFPRPFAQLFDNPYRHPETGYVRDERFKLYSDGSLFDVRRDPRERAPLPMSDGPAGAIRRKLQAVLDAMPARAARIPAERSSASRGVPRPRWPEQ